MKLDEKTLKILKSFSMVNNGIVLTEGTKVRTISGSDSKAVYAEGELGIDVPTEAVIYDLSRFLSTISLMNNPDIEFKESGFVISDDTTQVSYQYSLKEFIIYPQKPIKDIPFEVETEVPQAELQRIIKAAGTLSMDAISFVYDGDKLYLATANTNNQNTNNDTFKIDLGAGDVDSDPFNITILVQNMRLMQQDYKVYLTTGHGKIKSKIARFVGPDVSYWISGLSNG